MGGGGKIFVRNFINRTSTSKIPKNSNSEANITCFNNACCFQAVDNGRKTKHKKGFAERSCGLYPYCDLVFKDDTDIGFAVILEPENHPKFGSNAWICWHHLDANLSGVKVQMQTSKRKKRKCTEIESKAETKNKCIKKPKQAEPKK